MKAKNVSLYVLPRTDEHQVQNLIFRTNTSMQQVKELNIFLDLLAQMLLRLFLSSRLCFGPMAGTFFKRKNNYSLLGE